MRRKIYLLSIIALSAIIIAGVVLVYSFFSNPYVRYGGVKKFGHLELGGRIPMGPGDYTLAPPPQIPPSQFYIDIAQKGLWCVFEECSPEGKKIAAMGGWLQGEDTRQPEIREIFGLEENKDVASVVIVGNHEARITGIYHGKGVDDLPLILRIHPNIIKQ